MGQRGTFTGRGQLFISSKLIYCITGDVKCSEIQLLLKCFVSQVRWGKVTLHSIGNLYVHLFKKGSIEIYSQDVRMSHTVFLPVPVSFKAEVV